jgi:hypothetical protein
MPSQRRSARLLFLAVLAASACTDQTPPTAVPDGVNAAVAAAAGANNQKVKVKILQLGSNTLRIDGPSVSGNVSIGNSGPAISADVVVKAEITQGAVSREAVNTPAQCSPAAGDAGKLPTGSCEMTFAALASNSAPGSGTLAPGSATFTLRVIQTSDAGETELASKSVLVNLAPAPSMTVTIAPAVVLIDGAAATATAVIQNPANSLQGMLVQGWIVQGVAPNETRRPTGESSVTCGPNAGVLPPGTCMMTVPVSASNVGPGTGLFASGAATFELELIQSSGSDATTLDVKTAPITLVWGSPRMTRVEVQSTAIQIGGDAVAYTVDIQNGGAPRSGAILSVQIHQFINGTVVKGVGGVVVSCGGAAGELPTTGTGVCTIQSTLNAPDDSNGGALVPGDAVLFFDLFDETSPPTVDRQRVNITLLAPKPTRISGITISPTLTFGSENPYTATLQHAGSSLSTVVLQSWIVQGTARRAAGGQQVQCNNEPMGVLPAGECTVGGVVVPFNISSLGSGTLLPGPATLEVHLDQQSAGPTVNLDKRFIPVTLVMSGAGIIDLELSAPNVLIGEQIEYTATLYNPTGAAISAAGIQGYLSQGAIVDFGTGGTDLTCAGAGPAELPPGVCTVTFTLNTRNTTVTPPWNPGEASFRLELTAGATVLDSKSLPLFLNIIQ